MNRTELLNEVRHLIGDTAGPTYAWTDARLIAWLSEGQDKFCESSGFWSDKRSYDITTVLGQQDYPISDRIISIRSIYDGGRKLINATDLTIAEADFSTLSTQAPVNYVMGQSTGYVTFLEPVIAGVVLDLWVHRRSLVPFSIANENPEIPEQFHLAMAEYAAYKAFGDHDRELQDPVKATDHFANFKRYCMDGKLAYRRLTGEYTDVVPSPLYVV